MPFKTFTDGSVLTASDVNDYLMEQSVISCASGARPASPNEWMVIGETDTDRKLYWNGSAWVIITEPIQTWTPTITQSAGVALTVTRGWSRRANGLWKARAVVAMTASGTAGNQIICSTPYTLTNLNDCGGTLVGTDSGNTVYHAGVRPLNTGAVRFGVDQVNNYLGVSPAWTLASTDVLEIDLWGTY